MRRKLLALAMAGVMATATMTACDDSDGSSDASNTNTSSGGKARVGVILPDTVSSQRWGNDDPKYLQKAFDAAGVPVEIKNAEGDEANFVKIGESMINSGVKVLIIANLDAASGKAVLDKARENKIPTIDYDRLTLNGGANYYVSFDNEEVGRLQARELTKCLSARKVTNPVIAELNGSKADNNATLFKNGYDEILQPIYDNAAAKKGPDQWVPDWDPKEAEKIFTQMLQQAPNINGVLAANDGIGGAVIKVLKKKGLNRKVPVTGQDATLEGLQAVLSGDQCVTIFKPLEQEAAAAAKMAIDLFKGQAPKVTEQIKDPESGAYIPFRSIVPQAITKDKINNVLAAGFVEKAKLCAGAYAKLCTINKIGTTATTNTDAE
ncbi:sugar ABC transporter substrate-binding protein [Paractinoplanes atraurantiacus]|uniref:D-xylose transport system substrate-binding protein n=1 Tax=Paractinoplanes atraurantiacus TaxID=1036182 RepID=A0A285J4D0_9ACTN|nr:substrate-binding domain-containing protein [Actinoplanes atraurantiacus]SNY55058.1 D-xylose transport system substrate-binding protein [Actinoplanes atraurantiacus]